MLSHDAKIPSPIAVWGPFVKRQVRESDNRAEAGRRTFGKAFVYRETVVFPGTLLMRSGAYRRGGIRESDNRAEARRRALGKTADTIVRCPKTHGIDATVVSENAVSQELNMRGKGSVAASAISGVTALRQKSNESTVLQGPIVTTRK